MSSPPVLAPSLAPWLRLLPDAVEVRVRVVPRASRNRIAGPIGDRLRLQVTSPPVEGEANRAVLVLLAASAGLPLRSAVLRAGASGRSKTVRLDCDDPASVAARLQRQACSPR